MRDKVGETFFFLRGAGGTYMVACVVSTHFQEEQLLREDGGAVADFVLAIGVHHC